MPQQLSDAALLKLLDSDEDVSWLTPEEKTRMVKLASAPPLDVMPPTSSHDEPKSFAQFGPMQGLLEAQETRASRGGLKSITEHAPMAGGMVGAMAGGPLGAGAGGAAGTLIRDLARANRGDPNTPRSARDAASNVGLNAAGQAALSKGGDLVSKGLAGGAQRLYRGLLKQPKPLRKEFGDVAPELLAARRPITKGGVRQAESAVEQSADDAEALIANAPRPSPGISADRVTREFGDVVDAVKARVDAAVVPASELDKVVQRIVALKKTATAAGGRIDPERAQTLKKAAQEAATGAYKQIQRGGLKMLGTDDLLDAATARGFKGGIEDVVPGIGAKNAQTQKLIGQLRALEEATGRSGNHLPYGSVSDLAALAAGDISPALGVVGKAATMAGPGSRMAIGMNEAAKVPSAQVLRAIALLGLLQDER